MQRPFLLILVLLIPPSACVAYREYRDFSRFPRRFAEVIPDALYRGGYPTAENIRLLHDDKGIHTVINLTEEKATREERDMLAAVQQLGLKFFRISMPGDGCANYTDLDMAADAMANKRNWPVFFHCAAGKQRSNAALAAYRIKYCGLSVDQALAELQGKYDLDPKEERKLCERVRNYARWVEAHRPLDPSQATAPGIRAVVPSTPSRADRSPIGPAKGNLPGSAAPFGPGSVNPLPPASINPFGPASLPPTAPGQSKPLPPGNPKP